MGGIIKRGVPCIIGIMPRTATQVLSKISEKRISSLHQIRQNDIRIRNSSLDGLTVDFKVSESTLRNVHVSLAGQHQAVNALLAINAVKIATRYNNFTIGIGEVRKGLRSVKLYSGIEARLSIVRRNPLIIADVAHNQDAMEMLCASLRQLHIAKMHIVFGLMKDKAYKSIISKLQRITRSAFVVEARTERSRNADELAEEFLRYRIPAKSFNNVGKGIASVLDLRDNVPILITGSHFVVGEAVAYLKREKYLTINQ
jgi:dihydrofolate synthase/folylpolyglutamate synthase